MGHSIGDGLIVVALAAIAIAYLYFKHRERQRRLEVIHQERVAAMDKGIPLPELAIDPPSVPKATDPHLIARCRASGDEEAFAELVRRYHNPVFRLAVSILGQEFAHDAEDVAQEVMVRLYHALDSFRGDAAFGLRVVPHRVQSHAERQGAHALPCAARRRRGTGRRPLGRSQRLRPASGSAAERRDDGVCCGTAGGRTSRRCACTTGSAPA